MVPRPPIPLTENFEIWPPKLTNICKNALLRSSNPYNSKTTAGILMKQTPFHRI